MQVLKCVDPVEWAILAEAIDDNAFLHTARKPVARVVLSYLFNGGNQNRAGCTDTSPWGCARMGALFSSEMGSDGVDAPSTASMCQNGGV